MLREFLLPLLLVTGEDTLVWTGRIRAFWYYSMHTQLERIHPLRNIGLDLPSSSSVLTTVNSLVPQ